MEKKVTLTIEQITLDEWTNKENTDTKNIDKKKTVINISTEQFDGPLDVLYTMIMKHKIDITEISLSEITSQFFKYIKEVSSMELSGEFVDLITRLLFLKSSYLLKKNREAEELLKLKEEEEEIAKQLLEKLQEYKVYKGAAEYLINRLGITQGSYFKNKPEIIVTEKFDLESLTNEDLHKAIQEMNRLEKEKIEDNIKTRVTNEKLDKIYKDRFLRVEDQVENIMRKLEITPSTTMSSITKNLSKPATIVSFLALLEMMKAKSLHAEQEAVFEEIYVYEGPDESNENGKKDDDNGK